MRLTITAGTVIKFNANQQLLVYGTLDANGSEGNRVVFTSLKDDTYDGDTNGDGYGHDAGSERLARDLSERQRHYDGIGEFDYCLFRYGGKAAGGADANVLFTASDSGHMANCISEFGGQNGVRLINCSPQISDSTFRDNTLSGFYAEGSGTPTITGQHVSRTTVSTLLT